MGLGDQEWAPRSSARLVPQPRYGNRCTFAQLLCVWEKDDQTIRWQRPRVAETNAVNENLGRGVPIESATNPAPVTIKIAAFGGGVPASFDPNAFQLEGDVFPGGSVFDLTPVGNDVFLTFTPTPEPATMLLVAAAGVALAGLVRRRAAPAMPG